MAKPWDFMTEQELRYGLKLLRSTASLYNRIHFALIRMPELQALEILNEGLGIYERLSKAVDIPKFTREEVKKRLVENIDPVDALEKIILPAVKEHLENLECYMVERGYRLPRWHRLEWLEEMEGREYKGWRTLRQAMGEN